MWVLNSFCSSLRLTLETMTLATWQHTRRTGAAAHSEEDFDPEIKLFKLNTSASDYERNHDRVPDLSADIRVKFPKEEMKAMAGPKPFL